MFSFRYNFGAGKNLKKMKKEGQKDADFATLKSLKESEKVRES